MNYITPMSAQKVKQEKKKLFFLLLFLDLVHFGIIALVAHWDKSEEVMIIFKIMVAVLTSILILFRIHTATFYKKAKKILGADTDSKLDSILKSGTVVTPYVFIVKDHLVNLKSEKIYLLSEIKKAVPYEKAVRGKPFCKALC